MRRIEILDCTLRDGAQGEGIAFSLSDRLSIVKLLDDFGVDIIEAGNPFSNPKDMKLFQEMRGKRLKQARLAAFGSTCRPGRSCDEDEALAALISADTPIVTVVGKSSALHAEHIIKVARDENLLLIEKTMSYLKKAGRTVCFDAEHFFDSVLEDEEYAFSVLMSALSGGADILCLCDTNGGTTPEQIYMMTKRVTERFSDVPISIHCHDDIGCAVAGSMAAVSAGAKGVQGTFIGIGERCGNADLSVLIPNLCLKQGYECAGELPALSGTVTGISELCNLPPRDNRPYTGRSAFAHKAGMHSDGVMKLTGAFEHVPPETVGNRQRILMSEVTGRAAIAHKLQSFMPGLDKNEPIVSQVLERLKELELQGYQFEAADASFEIMARKLCGRFNPHFTLILYKTMGEFPIPDGGMQSSCMIRVQVDGRENMTAAMGNGPVNALDLALREALLTFYPELSTVKLTDYKVRVLEEKEATAARVRVLIESSDGERRWTTVGVSADIIEASCMALVDSIEYKLQTL